MSTLLPLRTLPMMVVASMLLSGCSITGNYPEVAEPDAAKLRFISKMQSATLNVFDAQHCMGRNTGLLNNALTANTKRRVGMAVPPPDDAKAYIEIRMTPGREQYLATNSLGYGSVCGTGFNLTPQPGAEYEVTFNWSGNHCVTTLSSLNKVNGEVSRFPLPVVRDGLPSCAGSNAMFPVTPQGQPDTPQRTAMIDQIIADSLIDAMQPKPSDNNQVLRALLEKVSVDERKKRLGFTLPQAYWDEYTRNLKQTADESTDRKARILQRYKEEYRSRLSQLDTEHLRKRLPEGDDTDAKTTLSDNAAMLGYYNELANDILKRDLNMHIARMADLDRRYDVCARFAKCWKN
ncbi:hypothetical protein [Pseudomonas putida]|uniref:Lipoprotein n=1 Tax=Pseudomonas putida TaxID=303 RepID=A0A1Q9R5S4_PSEPU|nr:hypothetical protein [Pseudomonas putida]OLS62695.1 hypothetical protein PSEMO_24580 [Pseudomonas putida]